MAFALAVHLDRDAQTPEPGTFVRVGVLQQADVDPADPEAPHEVVQDLCVLEVFALPVQPPVYITYFKVVAPGVGPFTEAMDGPLGVSGGDFAAVRDQCGRMLREFLEAQVMEEGGLLMGVNPGDARSVRLQEVHRVRVPLSAIFGRDKRKGKKKGKG